MSLEALTNLLGPATKTFKDGTHWWSCVTPETQNEAKSLVPELYVVPTYAYPDRVKGGQKYDVCFAENGKPERPKRQLMPALLEYIEAYPGCTSEQITAALKDEFPSAHFDTFLEVHASRREFCRVNLLVPETENHPQRLLTVYFPRGTTLGL